MSMIGTLVARGGKMYVLYESPSYNTPEMKRLWWRVQQWLRDPYSANSPEIGDTVRYADDGWWHVMSRPSGGQVDAGRGDADFHEIVPIPPPKVRGNVELRWHQGQWEKLLKTGWKPAGTGAKSGGGKRRHSASPIRLHRDPMKPRGWNVAFALGEAVAEKKRKKKGIAQEAAELNALLRK